jgi:hypothetical protein
LIIFEVHSVNFSYLEDNYIQNLRQNNFNNLETNFSFFKF